MKIGQEYEVTFSIKGRFWTSGDKSGFSQDLQCYQITEIVKRKLANEQAAEPSAQDIPESSVFDKF